MSDYHTRDKSRRSVRIHHRDRVQNNFECLLANSHSGSDRSKIGQWARYGRDNRTGCSGPCCGNPRKWFKELTMQERRADLNCAHKYDDEAPDHCHPDGGGATGSD